MTVTSAEWRDYDMNGFPAAADHRFLWSTIEMTNNGENTISIHPFSNFKCDSSDSSFQSIFTGVFGEFLGNYEIAPGNSANATVIFMVPENWTPEIVTYSEWEFWNGGIWGNMPEYSADVPTPIQGESHVQITIINATLNNVDFNNTTASQGKIFLWLEVEMNNNWYEAISLDSNTFDVEGTNGTIYSYPDFDGPDFLLTGGSTAITLVFEIPENWDPLKLRYDAEFAPFTETDIPSLT